MAKKDNSPAISFFSFQDIITSITGIMFLVVMMLVLLVVSRSTAPTAKEKQVDKDVAELQSKLDDLKRKIAANAASRDEMRRRMEELKQLDLASLEEKKAELLRRMEAVSQSISQEKVNRAELEKMVAAAREAEAKLQAESLQLEAEQSDAEKLQKEASTETETLGKLLKHKENVVRFVWQGNIAQRPLLAVCSKEEIAVQDGLNGKPLFTARAQEGALTDQFLDWCRKQGSHQYYFVLLVKPSAFVYAEVLSHRLKELGFERGREALPADDFEVMGGK